MAATSSGVSGLARSTPDTSPTNTGWIWRMAIVIDASLSQPAYAPNRNRSGQPLEGQWPHVLGLDQALDGPRDPGRDQDLSAGGLTTQPCRQVRDGPDRAVVHATLEADGADRGVALGDAYAQRELPAALAPTRGEIADQVTHGNGHAHGTLGRVRDLDRVVEKDHHPVAGEALERALVVQYQPPHLPVILAQDAHDLLRLGGLGEGGEPAQVDEHDGDLAPMGLEGVGGAAGHDQLGEVRREEALETPEPLELGDLLRDTPLQGLIELGELTPISSLLIVESLFLETSADPGLKKHWVERLGEVVLGAELDAPHHTVDLVERRDHQNRDIAKHGIGLQLLEHGVPVEIRHHHVEQDEIERALDERIERGSPAGCGQHLVALAPEAAGEHVAVVLVVVHDKDRSAVLRRLSGAGFGARRLLRALLNRPTTRTQQRVEPFSGRADAVQVGSQRV